MTARPIAVRCETVDVLLDMTNPGVWMAHCHIAEHHESVGVAQLSPNR